MKQPTFIKVMWTGALILFFALQTFAIFASKQGRELMHFTQFVLMVLAFSATAISNKVHRGAFLPGLTKKR